MGPKWKSPIRLIKKINRDNNHHPLRQSREDSRGLRSKNLKMVISMERSAHSNLNIANRLNSTLMKMLTRIENSQGLCLAQWLVVRLVSVHLPVPLPSDWVVVSRILLTLTYIGHFCRCYWSNYRRNNWKPYTQKDWALKAISRATSLLLGDTDYKVEFEKLKINSELQLPYFDLQGNIRLWLNVQL